MEAQQQLERAHDELVRATRLRDEFLALASHELRTPLTPLIGFLEILRRRRPELGEREVDEMLAAMERQVQRLEHLVTELLTMTEITAGTIAPEARLVDVGSVVAGATRRIQGLAAEVVSDAPAWVECDPDHLQQIVANLLRNAVVYGEPPVTVEVGGCEETVEIRVRDAGPGVPAHLEGSLFERFAQADVGDRRTAKGLGLGLSVCRELAVLGGATLAYERLEPRGSCFTVRLPRAAASIS